MKLDLHTSDTAIFLLQFLHTLGALGHSSVCFCKYIAMSPTTLHTTLHTCSSLKDIFLPQSLHSTCRKRHFSFKWSSSSDIKIRSPHPGFLYP